MTTANKDLALLDAIKIAMEAEKKAAEAYNDAAAQTSNPLGKRLFSKLTEFEHYHYQKLSDLLALLVDEKRFIEYVTQETAVSAQSEVDCSGSSHRKRDRTRCYGPPAI